MISAKRVTLKDVAAEAGCSVSAVSKVLNQAKGGAGVGQDLAQRIHDTAAELGYATNVAARSLRQGRSACIALIHGSCTTDHLWSSLIDGVHQSAREHNQRILHLDTAAKLKQAYEQGQIDAAIILRAAYPERLMAEFVNLDIPQVSVDACVRDRLSADLIPNLKSATEEAVAAIAASGKKNLLWVHPGEDHQRIDNDRWHYLKQSCAAHTIQCQDLLVNYSSEEWNWGDAERCFEAVNQHLNEHSYDAVAAFNDSMLPGVLAALHQRRLNIPQDVSVFSYDNILAHKLYPTVSSIDLGLQNVGEAALALVLQRLDDAQAQHHETIHASFIPRQSTRS